MLVMLRSGSRRRATIAITDVGSLHGVHGSRNAHLEHRPVAADGPSGLSKYIHHLPRSGLSTPRSAPLTS